MSMPRVVYLASLVILGVLITFTVFRPMATGGEYSMVQRAHFLEREDRWVIEFHIFNHEAEDTNYTITVLLNDELSTDIFWLRQGGLGKCSYHISRDRINQGKEVLVAVYKEGETTPIDEATYFLK